VARVTGAGERFAPGQRVGVPWLGWTDGDCRYCRSGRENLCDRARFTGYDIDGGYAERAVADERFCFPLPDGYEDLQAAPLLCAGLIGHRTLRLAGDADAAADGVLRFPRMLPEWLSPLAAMVPMQLFCYHLARAKGLDFESPRGLRKVTLTH